MKINIESYIEASKRLPQEGQQILAHQTDTQLVVYQAYNSSIANFAVKNQYLGGDSFSYQRMSWIKPNFLWMMFRSGWAGKDAQERILAFWIDKVDFDSYLKEAVFTSFDSSIYSNVKEWEAVLKEKEVRLQWDPDHDPFGNKLTRRAIQLGLKGYTLEAFGKCHIRLIEDITDFVKEQKLTLDQGRLEKLQIPAEQIYKPADESLWTKIGIEAAS